MLQQAIVDFQNTTKYSLTAYLTRYHYFLNNEYKEVNNFFSGITESIDAVHLTNLQWLITEAESISGKFKSYSSKFNRCDFWELMDYLDDLKNTIDKIGKLPKYRQTFLSKRGDYTSAVQVDKNIGAMKTPEDASSEINGNNIDDDTWVNLMLKNDMRETQWEIDKMSTINAFINKNYIRVTTVLDEPIGNKVLGIDITRKITIQDNDVAVSKYEDNLEQKCNILLALNRGDVPENKLFGKNPLLISESVRSVTYSQIVQEIQDTFLQNDLFDSVTLTGLSFEEGSLTMSFNIQTKYNYELNKTMEYDN